MSKKLLAGCGFSVMALVCLVMLVALFAVGANEVDDVLEEVEQALDASIDDVVGPTGLTDPFVEPKATGVAIETTEPIVSITCTQVKAEIDGATEFQRNQYLETLHGQVLSWQGQVSTVDEMFDIYAVFVTADGCEIRLSDLDANVAGALIVDQWYTVTGPVKSWNTLFGLEAVLKTSESTIE